MRMQSVLLSRCICNLCLSLSFSFSLYLSGLYICIYHLNAALSTTFRAHLICHNLIQFTIFIASSWQKCENVIKSNCISSAIRLQLSQREREREREIGIEGEKETVYHLCIELSLLYALNTLLLRILFKQLAQFRFQFQFQFPSNELYMLQVR